MRVSGSTWPRMLPFRRTNSTVNAVDTSLISEADLSRIIKLLTAHTLLDPLGTKMSNLQSASIQCPYCWEQIEVVVDCSVRRQEYVEDCSVCCRPIVITVVTSEGEVVSIEAKSEDE